jgi:ABC-2 type transport system permease protein
VAGLSPLEAAPKVTTDGVELNGLWWLIAIVVLVGAGAISLMRRRELAPAG